MAVKREPMNPTKSAQKVVEAQHNLEPIMAHVKAESVDVASTGSSKHSPPSADASNELDDLRRENEGLRKEKAELEERLKRSESEAKESRDECDSLQRRLQASEEATEAANKHVQELQVKVSIMPHASVS